MGCLGYKFGATFYFAYIFFIILFHKWACKEGFVQTLVKNIHDFYTKCKFVYILGVYSLFCLKLKNFGKFTWKQLCWSLILIKLQVDGAFSENS